ncbi:MAG: MurT ligase domain-containing protein [Chloroflexota bacterium]
MIAGHVVPRIDPNALRTVTRRLRYGSVLVSGTNGKTTTSRLISHILKQGEIQALHNRAGANLVSGLVSAIVAQSSLGGWPQADLGLFEVDEATVPAALREIRPRAVLLTNIFRDQLDRYGEVHFVADLWAKAIQQLPTDTTLVLNADDPLVATLGAGQREGAIYFGVGDASVGSGESPHASDARICPVCGTAFTYAVFYYGHLGQYACPNCGAHRPTPDVEATSITLRGDRGSLVTIRTPLGEIQATLSLPGLYNVYNALAATATCLTLGLAPETIKAGLESFTAAFGRLERVQVGDRELFLALVKNPVGFGEVLRTILSDDRERTLVIAINDHFADGTDISWLWDVDFEQLEGHVKSAICVGTRADDMAVRLKYALVPEDRILVEADPRRALAQALVSAAPGETIYVLPTYTAMLELRDVLRQDGHVAGFWQD